MSGELTALLRAASDGDQPALDRLVALVYVDLRQLARRCQSRHADPTLDTTGLVHECYLRFLNSGQLQVNDRAHFFNLAARIMRQLICDYARSAMAEKRGGEARQVELRDGHAAQEHEAEQCLAIDQALDCLHETSPRQARVVECRFFAGLSEDETAEALGCSLRSVQRDWAAARGWLARRMAS